MTDKNRYESTDEIAWCPGCGNFSILESLKQALDELDIPPDQAMLVSGIGQAAKLPHYLKANVFNGLHGRALPPAAGIHMVHPDLPVIVTTGDGDSYGEGGNHLIHNIRRNVNITHLVHDNQIYGLTKGQGSPTTALGQKASIQYDGVKSEALKPLALAVSLDCSFVARGFAGHPEHLKELMKQAILHKGYALVDILQPCVSYNKVNTFRWYKEHTYFLEESYDPTDQVEAFRRALEWEEKIPLGVLYRRDKPDWHDRNPGFREEPLVRRRRTPSDMAFLLEDYR